MKAAKTLVKKKHPAWRRQDKPFRPALPDNWRKPRGHHSKVRRAKKWKIRMPNVGWGTPKLLRNTTKGRRIVSINKIDDLKTLNEKSVGVVSAKLGLRSRLEIAKACSGKNYAFLNFSPEKIVKLLETKKAEAKKKKIEKEKEAKEEKTVKEEKKEEAKEEKAVKPVKPAKPVKGEKQ